ncbi:MAG TPA: Sec-independent protein translocase protein TatB [Pseudonocardia sp.]
MFENVGWGEILVLIIAGLFILGPERLPEAAAWLGRTMRQVREFASGAREQLNRELGPELEEFRKPLEDLRQPLQDLRGLRDFDPKRAVVRTLFNDDPPDFSGLPGLSGLSGVKPNGHAPRPGDQASDQATRSAPAPRPLSPGERPPIDPDAT